MNMTILGHWGAYPGPGEATAGLLLEANDRRILLDCGSGVLAQLFQYVSIEQLDAVVLTHYHADHVADLGCLQYAALIAAQLGRRDQPLPIYGPDRSEFFNRLTYKEFTQGYPISDGQELDIAGLKFRFQSTVHPEYNLAVRIDYRNKSLVYTGDTAFDERLGEFAKDCGLLICESSLYEGQDGRPYGHCNALDAGEIANLAAAKRLVLTHLPHYGDIERLPQQASQVYSGPIELARRGLRISL